MGVEYYIIRMMGEVRLFDRVLTDIRQDWLAVVD